MGYENYGYADPEYRKKRAEEDQRQTEAHMDSVGLYGDEYYACLAIARKYSCGMAAAKVILKNGAK